ncbi:MAG: protein kinase [Anaerolineae bacterium]|nr:protein kinase [Anaerolineae bacterium]
MLQPGQLLQNRYRVIALLGQGGMGAVYRAWDTRLNVAIALKEMLAQPGTEPALLERLREQFYQEATVLARLSHPYLVRVTDFFLEGPNAYLVMDFVQGESLDGIIKHQGALPEVQVLTWAEQLLDALEYCHEQGIIHRDIKPQNVIIRPDGRAILVDFGLVKLWNPTDPRTQTVMRGLGTPEYAPPEQYDTQSGHTDPRSDIYSLGATLYHALTGQAPPTATQRIARRAAFQPPRLLNQQLSATTDAAILQALELTVEYRFPSAAAMAQALRSKGRAVARPPSPATAPPMPKPPATTPPATTPYPQPVATPPPAYGLTHYPPPTAPSQGIPPQKPLSQGQNGYPYGVGPAGIAPAAPAGAPVASAHRKTGLYLALMGLILLLIAGLGLVYAGTEGVGPLAQFFGGTLPGSPTSEMTLIAEATATATSVPLTFTATPAPVNVTAAPTLVSAATSTSAPTSTPSPTDTPAPTLAPTATPRPATATVAPPTATSAPARPGVLLDFDRDIDWRRGDEPFGTLTRSGEQVRSGSSGKLEYDFPAVERNYVVFRANPSISLGGQPKGLTAWVYGDGSSHFLNAWVKDSAGEIRQYTFGRVSHQGWRQMTARFDDSAGWPNGPIAGTNNGQLDFPAQFFAFVLDGVPDGSASRGAIYLDELGVFYD